MERRTKEVKGLIAQDKYTSEIILSEPYAPFISHPCDERSQGVPREEVEKTGVDFGKSPVGTGPFKFVSMKEGEEIVLEANPDYFEGRPLSGSRLSLKSFTEPPGKRSLKNLRRRS